MLTGCLHPTLFSFSLLLVYSRSPMNIACAWGTQILPWGRKSCCSLTLCLKIVMQHLAHNAYLLLVPSPASPVLVPYQHLTSHAGVA